MSEVSFDENFLDFELVDAPSLQVLDSAKFLDKNFFVIVDKDDFNEANETLINKILSAISPELPNQTAVIAKNKNEAIALRQINTNSQDKTILNFGLSAGDLSLNCELVKHKSMVFESYTLVNTYPIKELAENQAYKKELWGFLQKWKT